MGMDNYSSIEGDWVMELLKLVKNKKLVQATLERWSE